MIAATIIVLLFQEASPSSVGGPPGRPENFQTQSCGAATMSGLG